MIIYNVTIKVEQHIAEAWLQWLLREHIPDILKTKCFIEYKVVRLLEVDESEGPTYAIQYTAESKADYNRYIEHHATEMRQRSFEKWEEQFIAFRSVMQVVQ
jgi:quinol monooxygenase YgiN